MLCIFVNYCIIKTHNVTINVMAHMNDKTTKAQQKSSHKKAYMPPALKRFGAIKELTAAGSMGGMEVGGNAMSPFFRP